MKIAIALYDQFTALTPSGPTRRCRACPARRSSSSAAKRLFRTDLGSLAVQAGASFAEVDRADILVVPGGPGTREMMNDQPLLAWVQQGRRDHAVDDVGVHRLAGARRRGTLKGVDATTHWGCMAEPRGPPARSRPASASSSAARSSPRRAFPSGIDMGLTLAARIAGDDVAKPSSSASSTTRSRPSTPAAWRRRRRRSSPSSPA